MGLGEAMGVAWWEVIGYHTIYPNHCFFPEVLYTTCFSVYPVLNAPE